jgi:hypothetical protein
MSQRFTEERTARLVFETQVKIQKKLVARASLPTIDGDSVALLFIIRRDLF